MEKKKYTQPYADIKLVSKVDVLSFSNDSLEFNDENNYLEDGYSV